MARVARDDRGGRARVVFPERDVQPLVIVAQRLGLVGILVVVVTMTAFLGRDGYVDDADDAVTLLDAFYYATVSITTTGYGDITPVTEATRLATALVITPARVLFLILLVGTTVEVLAARTRQYYRQKIWRTQLGEHIIICGFGTKGQTAARTLLGKGTPSERIVVIDDHDVAISEAGELGLTSVRGTATRKATLEQAHIDSAMAVVVAPDRDDAAVLITLTARECNPEARIVAAVREEENAHLLRQSGANSVITSSGAAGRLLGLATDTPRLVELLEDLLATGEGMDVVERDVREEEVGRPASAAGDTPVLGVVRGDELLRFDDARVQALEAGDRLICLCANPG
jgi:voltage-gated potassium channel